MISVSVRFLVLFFLEVISHSQEKKAKQGSHYYQAFLTIVETLNKTQNDQ
jgi:hypothetical protein